MGREAGGEGEEEGGGGECGDVTLQPPLSQEPSALGTRRPQTWQAQRLVAEVLAPF